MSTLTSDHEVDLSWIRTPDHLAAALSKLRQRRGLSLPEIERRSKGWTGPDRQELKRSTVSDALGGKTKITRAFLLSLITACDEPDGRRQAWLSAWETASATHSADLARFFSASPRELGIHNAITTPDATGELPTYVPRDFDFRLRTALTTNGPDRGCFVVLVGRSSTGKTRALYEAVYELMPDWWVNHPVEAQELLGLKDAPPRRTVFWLDELQQYLGGHPPLSLECVKALIRKGNVIVGTMWPDQYNAWTRPRQAGTDEADVRRLLLRTATVISVPDEFSAGELQDARDIATGDSRIRVALETRGTGLTQALAGGPALVMCWEQPPDPYAKAVITAAADAHRLGVQGPVSKVLLADAAYGYLRMDHRTAPTEDWLDGAVRYATEPLDGDVSALSPVDDGRPWTVGGYTVADYLAQYLRRLRRTTPVPHSAWQALVTGIHRSTDLRRLADSAVARLRYRYAELALDRLVHEFDDSGAAIELADLLTRQDRFERAVDVLRRRLEVDPRDTAVGARLSRIQEMWERVERIRPAANAGNPLAHERLTEMLVDLGVCDELRRRSESGDSVAAEKLAERLAEQGRLRELREMADSGFEFAAEVLADLHAARGDVEILRERAARGDRAAELRLSKVTAASIRTDGAASQVAALRDAADAGNPEAAQQLCTLLFELRAERELTAELEAGTYGAADRLIAHYTAEAISTPERLAHLRAFGLNADGQPFTADPTPAHFR